MNCLICNFKTEYYFSKTYKDKPFAQLMDTIGSIDYYKCLNCGFVLSKTHKELNDVKFRELNSNFHHLLENEKGVAGINQPPYVEQAFMIKLLSKNNIIDTKSILDYAGGYGTLSSIMSKYYNIQIPIYDPYVESIESSNVFLKSKELKKYSTIINSAMFEHIRSRDDLDKIYSLMNKHGSMLIHTRISEYISDDENWFYLDPPVHTAFHTNKSMEILMAEWGFRSSIYCLPSKCWVLLRENVEAYKDVIHDINVELKANENWFYCKQGFVDYWKNP